MTRFLEKAFERASLLSDDEQDEFARLILSELESERRWNELFAQPASEDLLERLAEDALTAHRAGRTAPLDPEVL